MSEPYTPTTDEIDTAATTYIWQLEKKHPGTYEEAPEFNDYGAVCKAFRRWLDQVRREAKIDALREAADNLNDLDPDGDAVFWDGDGYEFVTYWLRTRADQLEQEGKT